MADDRLIFYVYQHKEADTGRVFYIGRGTGKRWKQSGSKRNEYWHRIVKKHGGFIAEKIYEGITSDRANDLEVMLILAYGRENLCNLTDGGKGASGYIPTKEWRDHMSKKMSGRIRSKEWCENISISKRGDKHQNYGEKHKTSTINAMLGHGSNPKICTFTHVSGERFIGTINEIVRKYSLSKTDRCNLSAHRDHGRYKHVKGWSIVYHG